MGKPTFLRSEPGATYRTLVPIRVIERVSDGPYSWGFRHKTTVPANTLVVFERSRSGWGSDPALEFLFKLPDGSVEVLAEGWGLTTRSFEMVSTPTPI